MKRNLIYYVYPLRGSVWQWNVSQIKRFIPQFSEGKKIVVVAQDDKTEKAGLVADMLACADAEIHAVPNDKSMWETRWFLESLERVASIDENECTFYAHAKGVTKGGRYLSSIMAWTYALYFMNLGCIDLIDHLLKKYSTVGAFRVGMGVHPFPDNEAKWYYSGTFFWLRHAPLFAGNWRTIAPMAYGVESYPGRHIPIGMSYDLTDGRPHSPYMDRTPRMQCEQWLEEMIEREQPV